MASECDYLNQARSAASAKKRKRAVLLLFLFTFFALALIILIAGRPFQYLVIKEMEPGGGKYYLPVREEEEFTIKYIHSVDLLPVYETYRCKNGAIELKETYFYNFGAGMGLLKGRGTYVEEGDLLGIIDINEVVDPFVLRTGEVSNHKLLHRDRSYLLAEHFGGKARLVFQIERLSGLDVLTEVLLQDREIEKRGR